MTQYETERLRTDVERTRQELSDNVNRLGATVSPSTIAERQKAKVGQKVQGWRDRIMGAADDAGDSAMGTVHGLADTGQSALDSVQDTAHDLTLKTRQQTAGNPLAVGVIALGAGWLLGSLFPASEKEKQAAASLKEQAQPLVDQAAAEAKAAGSQMAENLKQPAQDAVDEVKAAASDSAQQVKQQAQGSAETLKNEAQSTPGEVQG